MSEPRLRMNNTEELEKRIGKRPDESNYQTNGEWNYTESSEMYLNNLVYWEKKAREHVQKENKELMKHLNNCDRWLSEALKLVSLAKGFRFQFDKGEQP